MSRPPIKPPGRLPRPKTPRPGPAPSPDTDPVEPTPPRPGEGDPSIVVENPDDAEDEDFARNRTEPKPGADKTKTEKRTRIRTKIQWDDRKVLTLGDAAYYAGAWIRGVRRKRMTRPMYASLQAYLARQTLDQGGGRVMKLATHRTGRSRRISKRLPI